MPGYCFSNEDWVSGIIWLVISGLDTTATVIVPVLLLVLPLLLEPLLEHAASAASAATQPTAPSMRSLNGGELMNEPPQLRRRVTVGVGNRSGSAYAHLSRSRSF